MRTRSLLIFIVSLALVALTACGGTPTPTEKPSGGLPEDEWGLITIPAGENVKIGMSSALAGAYAAYGQDMLNGVDLAIEDFGGEIQGFTIVSEGQDDGCEGAPAVTVAELFSADPNVIGVVGPMCSGSTVPASAIYAENHVVMITPSSTAVAVTAQGHENLFRTCPTDDFQAQVAVDFVQNTLGHTDIAIIHDQSIYGEGLALAIREKWEAQTGTVVLAFEGVTRGESDYSATIAKIEPLNPQLVYFSGMDAEGTVIVKQLRDAGMEADFMGPDGIKSKPTYIDTSGGAAEGSYATFMSVLGGNEAAYNDWEASFTEKYEAPIAYAAPSYDAAMIILNAAADVAVVGDDGSLIIPKKGLADAIRATTYEGITGLFAFNESGDVTDVSITIFKVEGGDFAEVETITP